MSCPTSPAVEKRRRTLERRDEWKRGQISSENFQAGRSASARHHWLITSRPSSPCSRPLPPGGRGPPIPLNPAPMSQDRVKNHDATPTLRVATFNTHAGVGRDGVRDLGRTAAVLVDLDLGRLAGGANSLIGLHVPQVCEVADKLGMAWLFVPAERRWWRNDYCSMSTPPLDRSANEFPSCRLPSRSLPCGLLLANLLIEAAPCIWPSISTRTWKRIRTTCSLRTVFDLFYPLQEPAILPHIDQLTSRTRSPARHSRRTQWLAGKCCVSLRKAIPSIGF